MIKRPRTSTAKYSLSQPLKVWSCISRTRQRCKKPLKALRKCWVKLVENSTAPKNSEKILEKFLGSEKNFKINENSWKVLELDMSIKPSTGHCQGYRLELLTTYPNFPQNFILSPFSGPARDQWIEIKIFSWRRIFFINMLFKCSDVNRRKIISFTVFSRLV